MQSHPDVLFFILPFLIFMAIAVSVARYIKNRTAVMFLFVLFSLGLYTLASLMELSGTELSSIFLWARLKYSGLAVFPALWALLVMRRKIPSAFFIPLFLIPAVTMALIWSTPFQELFFKNVSLDSAGHFPVLEFAPGIWYWVQEGFLIVCLFLGILFSLLQFRTLKKAGGWWWILFFIALFLPLIPSGMRIFPAVALDQIPLAPFCFALSTLLITLAFFRFGFFHISPLARKELIEALEDPFLAADIDLRIADCNAGFLALAGREKRNLAGTNVAEMYNLLGLTEEIRRQSLETAVEWEYKGKHFELKSYPVNRGRKTVGVVHYFHDFSKRKKIEQRLRQSLLRLEKLNDLSRLLAMWLGKGDLMKVTMQTATELLEAVFGALFFLESGGLAVRALAGIRKTDESESLSALLEEAAFGAITEAQTVRFSRGPYNLLAVPLNAEILHGQPGALVFVTRAESDFSDFETGLAESVARQLAVTTENARLFREVERLAQLDGLTGIFTRRHFESVARQQWSYAVRHKQPFCVIMADIDFFKRVNDTYGHASGDAVLRQLSERLRVNLREADVLGRYGGEEFVVLLPATGKKNAEEVAERIRQAVAARPMGIGTGDLSVTASFGVAEFRPGQDASLAEVIRRADTALYAAKEAGRNRVHFL